MERRDEGEMSTEDVAYGRTDEGHERGGREGDRPAEGTPVEGERSGGGEPRGEHGGEPRGEPGASSVSAGPQAGGGDASAALLSQDDSHDFERRWEEIQVIFVDEPRRSVEQADGLVAEVMKRLAEGFAQERKGLEGQWDRGDEVSTEDLRVALQRYRSFFNRLLQTRGG